MTSFCESHNYYKKMLELQEKLRKSEEERIRLEERFKLLLQESRDRHNTCINRLRFRYIEFLEEQRTTDERNYKLLEALDRVDNSLALMTARTDRLNSLRKQYEAYLRRICTVRADGVNDISGQQSDKHSRTEQRNFLPPEVNSTLPLQSSWSNYQPIKSAFLSPSKATKSRSNISFDSSPSSTVDSKAFSQRINNDQSVSQTCPKHLQHEFERVPTFNLSSPAFRQSQARLEARDFQPDSKLQSLQANTLRAAPHFTMPCYINTNANKPLDISQSRTPQSLVQYPIDPPCMQSLPLQQFYNTPLDNLQRKMTSGHFQNAPESMERNLSDAALNLDMIPHPSYLNYSSNDNEHDKNYIADTSLGYRNNANARQLSKGAKQTHLEEDEDKASTIRDSEFDRYMDRIRKLHRDLDKQTLEEDRHRQDTHSDSFNATALYNDSDVSTIDKLDENLANKVKQVLELAENLVSRTMNMNGAKCVEQEQEAEQKDHELRRITQSCTPVSGRNHGEISDALEGRVPSMAHAKDRIRNDITLQQPELNSNKNMENSKNQNSARIDGDRAFEQQHKQNLPELQNANSAHSGQDNKIYVADESELDQCLFSIGKDLEPWNLDSVEKQVKEIDLIDDIRDQTVEKDFIVEEPASNENKVMQVEPNIEDNRLEKYEAQDSEPVQEIILKDASDALQLQNSEYFKASETNDEANEISATQLRASEKEDPSSSNTENDRLQNVELPNTENISCNVELSNTENSILENAELADNKYVEQKDYVDNNEEKYNDELDANEDNKPRNITLNEERSNQNYEEADHAQDSVRANDVEYSNSNEEYNYDRNESDEYDKKEEYEGYANQECPQETNEQYEGYTDENYGRYTNEPENAYENDSNAQYQEDTDQKYAYPYNEQYNSNHEFVADENPQYEETKEREVPQQHENETKQECSEEYTEHQKESQNEGEEVLAKVDVDQLEKPPTTNGKKKEKDVIKSLLDSDTDSTLEQNISNTESDFDFN